MRFYMAPNSRRERVKKDKPSSLWKTCRTAQGEVKVPGRVFAGVSKGGPRGERFIRRVEGYSEK